MRITILGSGGVGGVLGLRLQQAGHDVAFVARGAHLDAIRADGLRLVTPQGDMHLPVRAVGQPADAWSPEEGAPDVVAVAVKHYDLIDAAQSLRPAIGAGTVVVPFLNGVDAPSILSEVLGTEAVAGGVARIGAVVDAPGVLRQSSPFADFLVGPLHPTQEAVLRELVASAPSAGLTLGYSDDIVLEQWKKLCFLAPFSALTALTRSPCGVPRGHPETAELFWAAVTEAVAVGRALGVHLAPGIEETLWSFVLGLPAGMKSSMLEDLERGRRLELPWLSGAVVRLGHTCGVSTPVHSFVCAALAPFIHGQEAAARTPVPAAE